MSAWVFTRACRSSTRASATIWGADVHLAARVAAAAHGGQILATGATAGCGAGEFEDLGEWRLKDFDRPTRLFQVVVDGEGADRFPAPRALDVRPSNLPVPENAMIGREAELRAVARMLSGPSDRLVTLVGLGGTGKTRLALAVGHELLEHFGDGVFFADLSGTTDPATISRVVADAVGAAGAPVDDAVRDHLARRQALVIVDNCEHVLDGVGVIATWLAAANGLRVLATSQAPLRLRAERCVPLDSLALPGDDPLDVDTLADAASVRLFVERVRAVDAGFELTPANAAPVAEICTRLEGIPMAIELAAARCGLLGPAHLAERLRDDLDALAAVARDVAPRRRSLRAALEWSLGTLGERERSLFARWGVFAGRPTVARVQAVCDVDLDAVETLVEHSFVRRDGDGRLRMPQSVQAHARALLASSGAEDELRRRHAAAMAAAAEDQHARFMLDTIAVIEESSADREDLLAALRWAAANAHDLHARLAGSIVVPRVGIGTKALEVDVEAALARTPTPSLTRLRLLVARATIAYGVGERVREREAFEAALATARQIGEPREHALLLAMFTKAVTSGEQPEIDALRLLATAKHLVTASGDTDLMPLLDGLAGEAYLVTGRLDDAAAVLADVTDGGRARHFAAFDAPTHEADLAFLRGDVLAALDAYSDVARARQVGGLEEDVTWTIEAVGVCLITLGLAADGVTLIGAAQAASERIGEPGRPRLAMDLRDRGLARAREQLGGDEADARLERGRRMARDVVMGLVLRAPTIVRSETAEA